MALACQRAARVGHAGEFCRPVFGAGQNSCLRLSKVLAATPMTRPSCDRHKNLQMDPFSFEDPTGTISGHICPVPGCGRLHDKEGYFDVVEGKVVRSGNTKKIGSPLKEQILNLIRSKVQT